MSEKRYNGNIPVFGEEAGLNFLAKFNTDERITPEQWEQVVNKDYLIGWETRKKETPTKGDFNGISLVMSKLIKHLYDVGIAFYSEEQTYSLNTYCSFNGIIYKSLKDNNKGNQLNDKESWITIYDLIKNELEFEDVSQRLAQKGFIIDFYGDVNNIPKGWHLCDGENGTPDLRGLFVVGYDNRVDDYNQIGKTGGAKEVKLTTEQMPSHTHTGSTNESGEHNHSYVYTFWEGKDSFSRGSSGNGSYQGTTSSNGLHSHKINLDKTGGNQTHENRPPFYVLAKIMYIGN